MSGVIPSELAATLASAAGLAALGVLIVIWWHVRGIQARDERDPRDGDLGNGWAVCPACDREFWQPHSTRHVACPTCRGGVR